YILSSVPAYILLMSGVTLLIPRLMKARLLAVIVMVGWGGVIGYSLVNYFYNPQPKSVNWPALTAYLHDYVEPDDLVIQLSADAAFGYYYAGAAPDIALPASPRQTEAEITTVLEANQTRPIWLVGQTFPDWSNAGVVERWAQAHMQLVHDTQTDGLRIQEYMPWTVSADEWTGEPLAEFDDTAALVGARVFEKPEPTGDLVVWLYWKPIQQTPASLKIFVHLAGGINPVTGSPLWSQDDQYPQDGRLDSVAWPVGEVFRDVYQIPLNDVLPGDYDLLVGFYDPVTNERVNVAGGDSYLLRSVHLGQ
ncbi:MAG: hypothetical protein K8I60_21070, partial [Anaerolineae bacterium]|nr:hypothetical protein [Anaerolineae bacterium]